jgi:hypothetical protein
MHRKDIRPAATLSLQPRREICDYANLGQQEADKTNMALS